MIYTFLCNHGGTKVLTHIPDSDTILSYVNETCYLRKLTVAVVHRLQEEIFLKEITNNQIG